MLERKPFSQHVVARLRDFFRPQERWFRGLWEVGLALTLDELIEAAEANANSVISDRAIEWLAKDVCDVAMKDPAIKWLLVDLLRCLKPQLRFKNHNWHSLQDLTAELKRDYLARWADLAAQNAAGVHAKSGPLRPERMARAVAGHMLDLGFSQQALADWLKEHLAGQSVVTLPDLIQALANLARIEPISYLVLVPVNSGLPASDSPDGWLDAAHAKPLIGSALHKAPKLRFGGAWFLPVQARDPFSAAETAFDEVDKRIARLMLARGHRMTTLSTALVFGQAVPVPVQRESIVKRVRVRSIERQQKIFVEKATSRVDAAFELLSQLDASSALATAAGWAAVEALLAGRTDEKVIAADRLALLVAASFPRAELTSLAADQIREKTNLGTALQALATNRERANLLATEIRAGRMPAFKRHSDHAAGLRMAALLANPAQQLQDIAQHAQRAFRRYYRQRNLVLHWGKTSPVALRSSLRTGTPLLAAGVDRIAHAWFVHGIEPIPLAIRVQSRIDLADRAGRLPTELLESLGEG